VDGKLTCNIINTYYQHMLSTHYQRIMKEIAAVSSTYWVSWSCDTDVYSDDYYVMCYLC